MEYELLKGGKVTYIDNYISLKRSKLLWEELNPIEIYTEPYMFKTINNNYVEIEGTFGRSTAGVIWRQGVTDYYKTKNNSYEPKNNSYEPKNNSYKLFLTSYPRLTSSMFDPTANATSYLNSDTSDIALKDWTPVIQKLKTKLETDYQDTISYAILNKYRNCSDYINYHSDREMKSTDKIYSISLGISRRFGFRSKFNDDRSLKTSGPPELELNLDNGSLIIFDCAAGNTNYKHSLFKGLKRDNHTCMNKINNICPGSIDWCSCERINITFRT